MVTNAFFVGPTGVGLARAGVLLGVRHDVEVGMERFRVRSKSELSRWGVSVVASSVGRRWRWGDVRWEGLRATGCLYSWWREIAVVPFGLHLVKRSYRSGRGNYGEAVKVSAVGTDRAIDCY